MDKQRLTNWIEGTWQRVVHDPIDRTVGHSFCAGVVFLALGSSIHEDCSRLLPGWAFSYWIPAGALVTMAFNHQMERQRRKSDAGGTKVRVSAGTIIDEPRAEP